MNKPKRLENGLRPAFEELIVYPVALAGIVSGPFVDAVLQHKPVSWVWDWAALIVALPITAVMVIYWELRGTGEQKRRADIRFGRYALAYLVGFFWPKVLPIVWDGLKSLLGRALGGG